MTNKYRKALFSKEGVDVVGWYKSHLNKGDTHTRAAITKSCKFQKMDSGVQTAEWFGIGF